MDATFDDVRTTMHKMAWLSDTRPEILACVNILSQVVLENYKPDDIKTINKLIQHVKTNPGDGLTFRKLDIKTSKIVVYSDGSFSSNNDGSSQVEYQIFISDKSNNANLIDFASVNPRRVVRSALGADKFGLADACDASILIRQDLRLILKQTLKILILTDSERLFSVIICSGQTTEKRLMIDIKAAREAYNEVIGDNIIWIRRNYNLVDAMTKSGYQPTFWMH